MDILAVLKFLIGIAKVDVNAKTNAGKTALHFASKNCTLEIVKYIDETIDTGEIMCFTFI